jgi:hypothetical protein
MTHPEGIPFTYGGSDLQADYRHASPEGLITYLMTAYTQEVD